MVREERSERREWTATEVGVGERKVEEETGVKCEVDGSSCKAEEEAEAGVAGVAGAGAGGRGDR